MFDTLDDSNFMLFAAKSYDASYFDQLEFEEDLKRIKYIKRLFRKYTITGDIKIRLVLNHIIVLQNVFGADVAISLLLFKVDRHYWPVLKACLDYLGYLYPHELNDIEIDSNVEGMLKEL